jgi:hypothetical protein
LGSRRLKGKAGTIFVMPAMNVRIQACHFQGATMARFFFLSKDHAPQAKGPDQNQGRWTAGQWQSNMEDPIGSKLDFADFDRLLFIQGGQGRFELTSKAMFSIGRNQDADIHVKGMWAWAAGSPSAMITRQAGDYFLRYVGGLIRPRHNGDRVKGTVKLYHEDIVQVGPVKFQLQLKGRRSAGGIKNLKI